MYQCTIVRLGKSEGKPNSQTQHIITFFSVTRLVPIKEQEKKVPLIYVSILHVHKTY